MQQFPVKHNNQTISLAAHATGTFRNLIVAFSIFLTAYAE